MRKQYDDFSQMKMKDMCKSISDMTYKYINPETEEPTKVPAGHYENILNQVTERYMADITSKKFLCIMYEQLTALKKEDEKYFNQALICMDMGINPKDLRINEQVALEYTNSYVENIKIAEKKDYHFLSERIVDVYEDSKNNPRIQSECVRESNKYEEQDTKRRSDCER